jgi:beta-glucosidase
VITALDGIRERAARAGMEVTSARGANILNDDPRGIPEAVALARDADVVIAVVGDDLEQVGEYCDRDNLDLSGAQLPLLQALKATGKPLIVVLINSKPLCIPWVAEHAQAVVEAFNPGMRGGEALAQILFGDVNPCAKLTVSFPKSIGQQPVHYQVLPGWHGSKFGHYDAEPLYAFGFGLSYTRYDYSEPRLSASQLNIGDDLRIEIDVSNAGHRAGVEIVQLYLNDVYSSLSTPTKTLKRFARVALEPGETRTVRFELAAADFAFIGRNEQPVIEAGDFEILVGASSRDIDLKRVRCALIAAQP